MTLQLQLSPEMAAYFGQDTLSAGTLRRYQHQHRRAWGQLLDLLEIIERPDGQDILRRTLRKERRRYLHAELARLAPDQEEERLRTSEALAAIRREEERERYKPRPRVKVPMPLCAEGCGKVLRHRESVRCLSCSQRHRYRMGNCAVDRRGKPVSAEVRAKISAALKGRPRVRHRPIL
jgi:hypothetical protein